MPDPETLALRCSHCGSPLCAQASDTTVECPQCGNSEVVPEGLRDQLQAHLARVAAVASVEARAKEDKAAAEGTTKAVEPAQPLTNSLTQPGLCGACGAPVQFQLGQVSTTCGHCGAGVLATHEVRQRITDQAVARADQAVEEALRATRNRQRAAYRSEALSSGRGSGRRPGQQALLIGALLFVVGGSACAAMLSVSLGSGSALESFAGFSALFAFIGLAVLVVGVLSRLKPEQVTSEDEILLASSSLRILAEALGGEVCEGALDATLEYLNAYWLDRAPLACTVFRAPTGWEKRWAVQAKYRGCPVLVLLVLTLERSRSWTGLFLAADIPYQADPKMVLGSLAAHEARAYGVDVQLTRSGVYLCCDGWNADLLSPATVETLLACALALVEIARATGAEGEARQPAEIS